jgi:prepilin-type N-terminal cleavage/methylation domain-containing protein
MIKRGEGGVTLIELSVVISIIAIMGVCLAPAIGEWLDNFRIRQAARDIISSLQFAKIKAISNCREYRVVFDAGTDTYQLQQGNLSQKSTRWNSEESKQVPGNVNIVKDATGFGATKGNIQFNPDATSTSGSIFIETAKGKRYRIIIFGTTGRIRMKEGWELN